MDLCKIYIEESKKPLKGMDSHSPQHMKCLAEILGPSKWEGWTVVLGPAVDRKSKQ